MKSLLLACLALACMGEEPAANGIPAWIVVGIAARESGSYWQPNGTFVYVNTARGKAGERGPFQVTPEAFADVAKPGERFEDMQHDHAFALEIACRYLWFLKAQVGTWDRAVAAYNVGPRGDLIGAGASYLRAVQVAAGVASWH